MNYKTDVDWDTTLFDLWFTDIDNTVAKGLVYSAFKNTAGAPTATAGFFMVGAVVTNAVTGIQYKNTGTTASPVFTVIPSTTVNSPLNTATIATTSNTDGYVIAPVSGVLSGADFSGVDALAASDTNYITFSMTNLGQAGAGTAAMLAATDANTTKATGGTALAANTKRSLTLTATSADLVVVAGDRIRVRAAATGTLANTVTFPAYILRFTPSA